MFIMDYYYGYRASFKLFLSESRTRKVLSQYASTVEADGILNSPHI
jgi:hypothetical protein